jgi:hypothetical protein
MGNLADWTKLEDDGLLPRSPGREEAVQATTASVAAKKEAAIQAMKDKATPRQRKRK